MAHPILLAREVEKQIHDILLNFKMQGDGTMLRFDLYKRVERNYNSGFGVVTSGFFNHIIADMKKAGIVGTCNGGDRVFLTDVAFKYAIDKAAAKKATERAGDNGGAL
jgi:hypothetical protein